MSHCTECGCEMLASEARLYENCFRCRKILGRTYPVNRFAAIWRRIPKSKSVRDLPLLWQAAAAYEKMQNVE